MRLLIISMLQKPQETTNMTKDDLFAKVKEVLINEFEIEESKITPEAKLSDDLDLDSIDAVDLIVKMRQFVGGKIDPEMFKTVKTLQNVVDILYPLVQNKN